MSAPPVMIMAGGTGGHVFPALALARLLRERRREVIWLGTRAPRDPSRAARVQPGRSRACAIAASRVLSRSDGECW